MGLLIFTLGINLFTIHSKGRIFAGLVTGPLSFWVLRSRFFLFLEGICNWKEVSLSLSLSPWFWKVLLVSWKPFWSRTYAVGGWKRACPWCSGKQFRFQIILCASGEVQHESNRLNSSLTWAFDFAVLNLWKGVSLLDWIDWNIFDIFVKGDTLLWLFYL